MDRPPVSGEPRCACAELLVTDPRSKLWQQKFGYDPLCPFDHETAWRIELAEAEARATPPALDPSLVENLYRALTHDRDDDTGDVWLHREDADRLATFLAAMEPTDDHRPPALDVLEAALVEEGLLRDPQHSPEDRDYNRQAAERIGARLRAEQEERPIEAEASTGAALDALDLVDIIEQAIFETDTGLAAALLADERIRARLAEQEGDR